MARSRSARSAWSRPTFTSSQLSGVVVTITCTGSDSGLSMSSGVSSRPKSRSAKLPSRGQRRTRRPARSTSAAETPILVQVGITERKGSRMSTIVHSFAATTILKASASPYMRMRKPWKSRS